jgi:hypothetical protein
MASLESRPGALRGKVSYAVYTREEESIVYSLWLLGLAGPEND